MEDILLHVMRARAEALRKKIKANTIVIDEDIAIVNGFYHWDDTNVITKVPDMIMGLNVVYAKNLSNDLGANFILLQKGESEPKGKPLCEYETEELLEEIKRRCELYD